MAFAPIRAIAETKNTKYSEKVFVNNKAYTVQFENKSYTVEPFSSGDIAKKALITALVEHEIEHGYFNETFKKESKELNRLLFKGALGLTGKCVQEAVTDPIKKLKDPVSLLGSFRGIRGAKSFIKFFRGYLSTWWTNLPHTLERRAVDPRLYAYRDIGQANRSFDKKLADARELLKDGFTYEEAKKAHSYLKEIKARMPHLIQLIKDVNSSKDPGFKVNKRDLKEFQILEWEGYGENRRIAAEDEQRLKDLRERIWQRVYSSEEYKRYREAVESAKSKTLEEIMAGYELALLDSYLTALPNGVKIEYGKIATRPYTHFTRDMEDIKELPGEIIWPRDSSEHLTVVDNLERISHFREWSLKGRPFTIGKSSIKIRHLQKPYDGIPEAFAVPKLKEQGDGFLIYTFVDEDYVKKFGTPSLSFLIYENAMSYRDWSRRLVYAEKLNFTKKNGIFLSILDTSKNTFPKEVRDLKDVTFLIGNFERNDFNFSIADDEESITKILYNREYFLFGFDRDW